MDVVVGVGGKVGKSVDARDVTARIELRVVSGSCGIAASIAPTFQACAFGITKEGCHRPACEMMGLVVEVVTPASTRPREKTNRA